MKNKTFLSLFILGITVSWLAPPADARRTERRLTRLLRPGWCALSPDNPATPKRELFVFTADGPSATITVTTHTPNQRLDNVYLVELEVFDEFAKPHDLAAVDCDTTDLIYDYDALGSEESLLELFDEEPRGWRFKDAAWIETGSAPRLPFGTLDTRGGALAFEPGGWASTTVEGLRAGTDYVVGGWSFWADSGEGTNILTVAVDTNLLTLHDGRFEVRATWRTGRTSGQGHAVPLSDVMGLFWLSNPEGADVMIKLLERCSINDHFAVSISGLVDREVNLAITDTQTGRVVTYENPFGTLFVPFKDREAFPCP